MINEAKKYLNADLVTKYRLLDYYNANCFLLVDPKRRYRIQYNDNWCATFVSVIAHKCKLGSDKFPFEVSVYHQTQLAKKMGIFTTKISEVKPNDLIVYDWGNNGTLDHVGIVIEVSEGTVKVIEGNIRNTVGYRTLPVNSKSIYGYIKTGYKDENINPQERIADLAQRTVRGDFGNGVERIRNLGADYAEVQKYINVMYT